MARIAEGAAEADRPMLEALARRVRQRRAALGIGTVEFGERANVSHSYVSRLERGHVPRPTLSELARVAKACGYSGLSALLDDQNEAGADAELQALARNTALAERFKALAIAWDSAPPAVQAMVSATLDALATQMQAGGREAENQEHRRIRRKRE